VIVERIEESEATIERTDDVISPLVAGLPRPTDEKVEIVEETVGECLIRWIVANQRRVIIAPAVG
jgi:hypothetical protein